MIIFLPWQNEFGTLVSYYCRWIHGIKNDHKIVCAKRGHEALYPSANEFFYDWEDMPDDLKRGKRTFRRGDYKNRMDKLIVKLTDMYPGWEIMDISHPRRVPIKKEWDFTPKPTIIQDIPKCDVVFAPRFRKHASGRNYESWPEVAKGLKDNGLTIGTLGVKEFSYDIDADVKAWDYEGNLDADIQMMQEAKLVLALDSGIANLAVLCDAPLKIIYDKPGKLPGVKNIRWMMDIHQGYANNHTEPVFGWSDPKEVVRSTMEYLEDR